MITNQVYGSRKDFNLRYSWIKIIISVNDFKYLIKYFYSNVKLFYKIVIEKLILENNNKNNIFWFVIEKRK